MASNLEEKETESFKRSVKLAWLQKYYCTENCSVSGGFFNRRKMRNEKLPSREIERNTNRNTAHIEENIEIHL